MPQKIIISDIDDVITIDRAVDERAMKRIKQLVGNGFKVGLATANTETRVREAVLPLMQKHGLVGKVPIFAEFGFYEIKGKKVEFSPEAKGFRSVRKKLLKGIYETAEKRGMKLLPDKEKHVVTVKVNAPRKKGTKTPTAEDKQATRQLIEETINRLGLRGKITLSETKRGFDVIPTWLHKGQATTALLRKWGLSEGRYKGIAFGDQFRDRKLVLGAKMKFVPVIESSQFLKETNWMRTKFLLRGFRRLWAGVKRKSGPKVRKTLSLKKLRRK